MADNLYTSEWKDTFGTDTSVNWFPKGLTGAASQYKFTAAGVPLVTKLNGKTIHDIIKGSDITFNIMIQDATDETHLLKLLDETYYVNVAKGGTDRWYGQLFPRFFNQVYNTFPYQVSLTANDRIGGLKEEDNYMIDYPEPGNYRMIDIITIILASFDDGTFYAHAPSEVRICTPLYYISVDRIFESVYLDPRTFMSEDDQYINKYELLENLLKPFGMYILQRKGIWYIIDPEAYTVDGTTLRYTYYTFPSGLGVFGGISSENILVDLFANKTDNKLVNSTAFKSYTKPVSKLRINKSYQPRLMVLDVNANRSGNFYDGEGGIELEFDSDGDLRHWDNLGSFPLPFTYVENSGWLKVPISLSDAANWKSKLKILNVDSDEFDRIRFHGIFYQSITDLNLPLYRFPFTLKWVSTGPTTNYTYYLSGNNIDDNYEWQVGSTHFRYNAPLGESSLDFDILLPELSETQTTITLTLDIHPFRIPLFLITGVPILIKELRVQVINNNMDAINYKKSVEYVVGEDNVLKNIFNIDLRWGIGKDGWSITGEVYHSDLILSRVLDVSGIPSSEFTDGTSSGNLVDYWLKNKFIRYNKEPTPILNGDIRSDDTLSFISMIQDYENLKYIMLEASYEDKKGVFTGRWRKLIDPAGDYFEPDYNDDYLFD